MLPPYVKLLAEAELVAKRKEATINLVQVNNMNPKVLLKEILEEETIILTQVDSTVEGLKFLKSLIVQHQENVFLSNILSNRKQVAIMLLKKREQLAQKVENFKLEQFKRVKQKNERVSVLVAYLELQIQLLELENVAHEKRQSTPRNVLTNSTLISELVKKVEALNNMKFSTVFRSEETEKF